MFLSDTGYTSWTPHSTPSPHRPGTAIHLLRSSLPRYGSSCAHETPAPLCCAMSQKGGDPAAPLLQHLLPPPILTIRVANQSTKRLALIDRLHPGAGKDERRTFASFDALKDGLASAERRPVRRYRY